jgi:membrane associated rhomboid family serine protease
VFGLLVGRLLLALGRVELDDEPRVIVAIDRASPRTLVTAALIVCGVSLIAGHFGGLYWLAAAHVGALLGGLLNAWVFLLVASAHTDE